MKTSESIKHVLSALFKVQTQMNKVIKDSKNPFFKSNYADINALQDELKPLLTESGLVVMQPPTTQDGKNYIETYIGHPESGEFMSSLNEIIVAKQNDPQSYLAAQTYTRRGALQATFNMGAVDDDGNYASGRSDKLENSKIPPKNNTVPPKESHSVNSNQVAAASVTVKVIPVKPSAVAEFQAAKPKTTSFKAAAEAKKQPIVVAESDDLDL